MSMIGNYLRVSEAELNRLLEAPESISSLLYPESPSSFSNDRHLDIDKSWQLIQFLLTGDPWEGEPPLRNVVMGGTELGDVDVGYGPARYLTPTEVQVVTAALASLSPQELWSRFDAEKIRDAEIYPDGCWEEDPTLGEYVQGNFQQVKDFFSRAAQERQAVLLWIN
jgi:hypothetical protein